MANLRFDLPTSIEISNQAIERIGIIASHYGNRVLLVADDILSDYGHTPRVRHLLETKGLHCIVFNEIPSFPTSKVVEQITEVAKTSRAQMIIGMGGVHTLSIAKTSAKMVMSTLPLDEYLSGEQFTEEMLPYIEVPTTCRNPTMFTDRAILVDARDRSVKKVILHSYPKAVLIDPGLSTTLSAKYTLTTMVDAFLNAFEGYISKRGNFFSEMLFSQAFGYIVPFLRQAHEEPGNIDIRMKAAQGGLLTGLGLHMSYPGLGHALSQVISGRFRVPQAAIATVLLPHILERSVTFCPLKMAAAAESIGEETRSGEVSSANYLVEYSRHLIASLRLPLRLSDFELSIENLISIVDTVQGFEGIGYLPEQVTTDDIINLLRQAY